MDMGDIMLEIMEARGLNVVDQPIAETIRRPVSSSLRICGTGARLTCTKCEKSGGARAQRMLLCQPGCGRQRG